MCPTNSPFWKYPEDVDCCVRTHSQEEKKQKKGANKEFDQYFKKYFDRWIFTNEHEIPILREF